MEPQRENPREGDREKGLQELRRLESEHAAANPALRAVHRCADQRNEKQQRQKGDRPVNGKAPRLRLGQHRHAQHHRNADHHPHQLAIEIIERVERRRRGRQFLRGNRRGGRDRNQPRRDQHRYEKEQDAVDFPEPQTQRGAVGAAQPRPATLCRARGGGDHRPFGRVHIVDPPTHIVIHAPAPGPIRGTGLPAARNP